MTAKSYIACMGQDDNTSDSNLNGTFNEFTKLWFESVCFNDYVYINSIYHKYNTVNSVYNLFLEHDDFRGFDFYDESILDRCLTPTNDEVETDYEMRSLYGNLESSDESEDDDVIVETINPIDHVNSVTNEENCLKGCLVLNVLEIDPGNNIKELNKKMEHNKKVLEGSVKEIIDNDINKYDTISKSFGENDAVGDVYNSDDCIIQVYNYDGSMLELFNHINPHNLATMLQNRLNPNSADISKNNSQLTMLSSTKVKRKVQKFATMKTLQRKRLVIPTKKVESNEILESPTDTLSTQLNPLQQIQFDLNSKVHNESKSSVQFITQKKFPKSLSLEQLPSSSSATSTCIVLKFKTSPISTIPSSTTSKLSTKTLLLEQNLQKLPIKPAKLSSSQSFIFAQNIQTSQSFDSQNAVKFSSIGCTTKKLSHNFSSSKSKKISKVKKRKSHKKTSKLSKNRNFIMKSSKSKMAPTKLQQNNIPFSGLRDVFHYSTTTMPRSLVNSFPSLKPTDVFSLSQSIGSQSTKQKLFFQTPVSSQEIPFNLIPKFQDEVKSSAKETFTYLHAHKSMCSNTKITLHSQQSIPIITSHQTSPKSVNEGVLHLSTATTLSQSLTKPLPSLKQPAKRLLPKPSEAVASICTLTPSQVLPPPPQKIAFLTLPNLQNQVRFCITDNITTHHQSFTTSLKMPQVQNPITKKVLLPKLSTIGLQAKTSTTIFQHNAPICTAEGVYQNTTLHQTLANSFQLVKQPSRQLLSKSAESISISSCHTLFSSQKITFNQPLTLQNSINSSSQLFKICELSSAISNIKIIPCSNNQMASTSSKNETRVTTSNQSKTLGCVLQQNYHKDSQLDKKHAMMSSVFYDPQTIIMAKPLIYRPINRPCGVEGISNYSTALSQLSPNHLPSPRQPLFPQPPQFVPTLIFKTVTPTERKPFNHYSKIQYELKSLPIDDTTHTSSSNIQTTSYTNMKLKLPPSSIDRSKAISTEKNSSNLHNLQSIFIPVFTLSTEVSKNTKIVTTCYAEEAITALPKETITTSSTQTSTMSLLALNFHLSNNEHNIQSTVDETFPLVPILPSSSVNQFSGSKLLLNMSSHSSSSEQEIDSILKPTEAQSFIPTSSSSIELTSISSQTTKRVPPLIIKLPLSKRLPSVSTSHQSQPLFTTLSLPPNKSTLPQKLTLSPYNLSTSSHQPFFFSHQTDLEQEPFKTLTQSTVPNLSSLCSNKGSSIRPFQSTSSVTEFQKSNTKPKIFLKDVSMTLKKRNQNIYKLFTDSSLKYKNKILLNDNPKKKFEVNNTLINTVNLKPCVVTVEKLKKDFIKHLIPMKSPSHRKESRLAHKDRNIFELFYSKKASYKPSSNRDIMSSKCRNQA